jgi:glycosyltransferase involved in cell wall biosynthesis
MIRFSYWKISLLIGIVILCVLIAYYLSERTESFANKQYKYGILIYCYNRPEFLIKTLNSLKTTDINDLNQSIIYIIDDYSTDSQTTKLIEDYDIMDMVGINKNGLELKIERNREHFGIAKTLEKGFTFLFPKCEYLTNIDSNVNTFEPLWLSKTLKKFQQNKQFQQKNSYYSKNGINIFFHRDMLPTTDF